MTVRVQRPSEPEDIGQRRFSFVAVLLLVALAVTLAGIFPFRQMIAQRRQVEQTQARYETLVEANRSLEERIELLNTPLEIERIAREEYGLVRPGEIGYRAVPLDRPEVTVIAPPDEPAKPVWERVWDFLTGRDLVPDG